MKAAVRKIADQVKALPESELEEFLAWLAEYGAGRADGWDREIERDSQEGGALSPMLKRVREDTGRALPRCGNVASADDWQAVLEPVIERYRRANIPKFFRGDAAFAIAQLYEVLEAEGYQYVIHLKANAVLEHHIGHLLTRPAGRPPKQPQRVYHSFEYLAESWDRARRVVAKIEWHQGELFPRVGFIVTNLTGSPESVVKFYNQRGTAAQWILSLIHI